jgi:hypothetical protein
MVYMSSEISYQLPRPGAGYDPYEPGENQFGTQKTIDLVVSIGIKWMNTHPYPFGVGDISYNGGGPMDGHTSGHKLGREVDVRPMRNDNTNSPTNINDSSYSRETTRRLLQVIREVAGSNIRLIYFNDSVLANEGLCQTDNSGVHNNHLHVAFHP